MPHDGPDHTEPPGDLALRVKALESLLIEKGLVDARALDEIIDTYQTKVGPQRAAEILAGGGPTLMDIPLSPQFQVGDRVRIINAQPTGHTRLPRYIRGRVGVIDHYNGVHVFADASALGHREGQPINLSAAD